MAGHRVAGNVLDTHALGSIIYAVEHLGSRLIAVIGHSKCGACKAAQGAWVAKAAAGPGKETPAGTDPVSQLVGVILGSCDTVAKANTGINTGSKTEVRQPSGHQQTQLCMFCSHMNK